jgi:hypothetical protein
MKRRKGVLGERGRGSRGQRPPIPNDGGGGGQARHRTAAAGGEVMPCSVGQGWAPAGNGRGLTSRPGQSGSGGPQ